MSWSHGCATAQNFPDFAQNLEICMPKLKIMLLPFLFRIHTNYIFLVWFLPFFLAQNFKTKVWPRKKIYFYNVCPATLTSCFSKVKDRQGMGIKFEFSQSLKFALLDDPPSCDSLQPGSYRSRTGWLTGQEWEEAGISHNPSENTGNVHWPLAWPGFCFCSSVFH